MFLILEAWRSTTGWLYSERLAHLAVAEALVPINLPVPKKPRRILPRHRPPTGTELCGCIVLRKSAWPPAGPRPFSETLGC